MELTESQLKFLAECEEEFSGRYTENDVDFMELKSKPLSKPPIVDPWGSNFNRNQREGGYQSRPYGHHGRDRHWRGGQSWNRDSNSRRDHDDNRYRDRSYDNRDSHRSYEDRGTYRDRPHDDRGSRRDRPNDDRSQHRRDNYQSNPPRYQPY